MGTRDIGRPLDCVTPLSAGRSEEHTSELQSRLHLVCRLLLEKIEKDFFPLKPSTDRRVFYVMKYITGSTSKDRKLKGTLGRLTRFIVFKNNPRPPCHSFFPPGPFSV